MSYARAGGSFDAPDDSEEYSSFDVDLGGVQRKELKADLRDARKEAASLRGARDLLEMQVNVLRKLQKEATVEEIREHLVSGMSRVIDFFRACDENGDGKISRQEFHAAMPKLGIGASSVDTIDELYESFDLDGDGTLEYRELHTILRYEARRKVTSSPVRRRR